MASTKGQGTAPLNKEAARERVEKIRARKKAKQQRQQQLQPAGRSASN